LVHLKSFLYFPEIIEDQPQKRVLYLLGSKTPYKTIGSELSDFVILKELLYLKLKTKEL